MHQIKPMTTATQISHEQLRHEVRVLRVIAALVCATTLTLTYLALGQMQHLADLASRV